MDCFPFTFPALVPLLGSSLLSVLSVSDTLRDFAFLPGVPHWRTGEVALDCDLEEQERGVSSLLDTAPVFPGRKVP